MIPPHQVSGIASQTSQLNACRNRHVSFGSSGALTSKPYVSLHAQAQGAAAGAARAGACGLRRRRQAAAWPGGGARQGAPLTMRWGR